MSSKRGLYAYGIVGKSPQQFDIVGIDKKSKAYAVEGKDLCVIVSEIAIDQFQNQVKQLVSALAKTDEAPQYGAEEILQAHENVVQILMKETTVVPFKFGTILHDESAAAKMMYDEEERFKKLLAKFAGKAEWGLKVYADQQVLIKHIAQIEPRFKTLAEQRENLSRGAAYLLGRKMEEEVKNTIIARLANVTEIIFQELGKTAYEAKLNKTLSQKLTGKKKEMLLNTVYLVDREKVAHFCCQGKRLTEQYESIGLDFEVSGPWAPYSFI